jgi:hypothetical protein
MDVSMKDESKLPVIDIQIELKKSRVSEREVDARTRELAKRLRLLPHKTVGIVNKQDPEPVNESECSLGSIEGIITMSLLAPELSAVLKLLRDHRGLILKGPNGMVLDFDGSVSEEQINVWRNAIP